MNLIYNNKRAFIKGLVFGAVAPIFGLFAGLQIAPILGNIFMFPFLLIGMLIDEPIGNMSVLWIIIAFLCSIIIWGFVFIIISKIIKALRK